MAKFRDAKHIAPGKAPARHKTDAAIADQVLDLKRLLSELGRLRPLRDPISAIDHDLTPPQLHSVLWLGADGPLPATVLSQRVGCGPPSITGVIDRLEKLGYVERERGLVDRRVVRAKLTSKGAALYRLFDARISERLGVFLGAMSDVDRAHLVRIFGNVVENFRARLEAAHSDAQAAKKAEAEEP